MGSGVEAGSDSCPGFLAGEALADLISPPFGVFFFSGPLQSSVRPFGDDQWV